jgi:general secretion pathway protein D
MDFRNADIRKVAGFVSEVTGRNFIVGPDVAGTISVVAPTEIPVDEVFAFFQSVLEVHGYTTVASGKMVKIISSGEARTRGVETMTRSVSEKVSDKMITKVIHLHRLSPVDAKGILSPLVSENGEILAYPQTKTLIITDPQSNVRRLEKLLEVLDVPGAEEKLLAE